MKDIGDSHAKAPDEFQPFKGGLLFETTMKQTAVEWLWNESQSKELQASDFEQALAMEKEQIMRAVYDAMGTNFDPNMGRAEQYYNETYKSDNQ